jgi:hypothetical protein
MADAAWSAAELARAAEQYRAFRCAYADPVRIPRSAREGRVRMVDPEDWTSGFVAGSFWLLYQGTGDPEFRRAAEERTAVLAGQARRTDTHDIGFVIQPTFGAGHRLTGNEGYASVVLQAARSLGTRFNATVGAIRSWDFGHWTFPVIIDNLMNLELLYYAASLSGHAEWAELATLHALTTRAQHFRADASSYHVVDYDPQDGSVIRKQTNQGLSDESTWARGQAWGLYGYTMCYRMTGDPRFLAQAVRLADLWVSHGALPDDRVPWFDFTVPERNDVPRLRDASAGAIATSALLELVRHTDAPTAERYRAFAVQALRSLSSPTYRAEGGENSHFLLRHSVGNYPLGDEIDVAINYADYYYLEALVRCATLG